MSRYLFNILPRVLDIKMMLFKLLATSKKAGSQVVDRFPVL
jgi:hypothetical protein